MKTLLNSPQIVVLLNRLVQEIGAAIGKEEFAFLCVQPRGIELGSYIFNHIKTSFPEANISLGIIDITLYRDDLYEHINIPNPTQIPFSIHQKKVILFDDVLYTGRTTRAALDALNDFGRPKIVWLCVLIDRKSARQLPIQANFSGCSLDIPFEKKMIVELDFKSNNHVIYEH